MDKLSLLQLPFIASMDYTHKLKAQSLIERGAPLPALYFWYNLQAGHYKCLPERVLVFDLEYYGRNYPEFKEDFSKAHQLGQAL